MSLANDYRRQAAWRDWPTAFAALPSLEGKTVLDVGCAIGDQAAELVAHGARVIGVDANADLLKVARARGLPPERAEFRQHDLRALPDLGEPIDGVWCSFTAAYFVDLEPALKSWIACLAPGGFIALTEVDDLFAHTPLAEETRAILDAYADDALRAKRYDFRMGKKLAPTLEAIGFTPAEERSLGDAELSFSGPAAPDVLEAWQSRLDRMVTLKDFAGDRFDAVARDFLACLARPEHRSGARVHFCLATA
ncbi:MAG: class I SAM-dependent methyltransferase [Labilithrix sp.]|nr:class I SAM-dependent methyltransferase [Labilithrix sp.]MCW5813437.1 class I SAM-dependent methyltransferase [Labilithrix sp.]